MRVRAHNGHLSVHAVAGTNVILLGIKLPEEKCDGLLGFALQRSANDGPLRWLKGSRIFGYAEDSVRPGDRVPTNLHPIQDFLWSDFTATAGIRYRFRIVALRGNPEAPEEAESVEVAITTESPDAGDHDITFNRGAASSQQYVRQFQNRSPAAVGAEAWNWLSRGLAKALKDFIGQANDATWGLRVAAYEFTYPEVLEWLLESDRKGADVLIIYHARERDSVEHDRAGNPKANPDGSPVYTQAGQNRKATRNAGVDSLCRERQAPSKSSISHNKFIVLLKNGEPVAVMTGSTNFTRGGIFGHSNVVHTVQDPVVAKAYLDYWNLLSSDPETASLAPALDALCPLPGIPPHPGTSPLFSPRTTNDALTYYQQLAFTAKDGLFMTFAFGMHPLFQNVYATSTAPVRYALMEKMVVALRDKDREEANRQLIIALRRQKENEFAIGAMLPSNAFDIWLKEQLTGLNPNVKYLHTKFMLVDPLSEDPVVVTGSANFSENSCTVNDENMLVIRGNKRVADIYLGEYMRLHRHYAFREWATTHPDELADPVHEYLDEENTWWRRYFQDTGRARRMNYFA